jgi:ADP-ribose pyrophosphatase
VTAAPGDARLPAPAPSEGGVPAREVRDLEVVEDRSAPGDGGFLRVRRLVLRTVFADGRRSEPYPCDVVSRRSTDAVALVLHETLREGGRRRRVRVALKTAVRPPVWLRRRAALSHPDERTWDVVAEVVAGMLEPQDAGAGGVERRAAAEAREEAGLEVAAADVGPLGAESFPSPGITDEKVHFRAAEAPLAGPFAPAGDGSAMEEGGGVRVLPLRDAIAACRTGEVPDMKTEVALLRLADAIGYLPALDRFVEDLPDDLRRRFEAPGLPDGAGPRGR